MTLWPLSPRATGLAILKTREFGGVLRWGIPYVVDRKLELATPSGDRPKQRRQRQRRTPCQKRQQLRDLGHSVRIPHICVAICKVVELMVASSVEASLSPPLPARPPATISLGLKQPLLQLVSSRCSLNWIEGALADLFEVLLVGQPGSLKLIKTESSTSDGSSTTEDEGPPTLNSRTPSHGLSCR